MDSPLSPVDAHVREKARELGFDAVGVARADVPLEADFERYEAFVAAGFHGGMEWLAENREARRSLDHDGILAGAKSVVCVARGYQRAPADEAHDPPLAQLVARYARGRDYHNFLRKKLRRLAAYVRTLANEGDPEPVRARPMMDDAPILERAWAARAGLGFVGKNGLLIVPGQGSFLLLGEVVTTLALTPDAPMSERCGTCTACLTACPTQAFPAPWVLEARKCISYLTIEHRGAVEPALKERIDGHLFGCDDCQTVCPFNAARRARENRDPLHHAPDERWSSFDLVALVSLDDEGFRAFTQGSPLFRATRGGLVRTACLLLGARGEKDALGALARVVREDPDLGARDAALWAITRLASLPSQGSPHGPADAMTRTP